MKIEFSSYKTFFHNQEEKSVQKKIFVHRFPSPEITFIVVYTGFCRMNFGYLNQPRLDDTLVIDLLDPVSLTRFEYMARPFQTHICLGLACSFRQV